MRIIVLTQNDSFFIPKNINKVADISEVIEIVLINGKGSFSNKLSDFLKWFGYYQVFRLGQRILLRKIKNIADRLFGYNLFYGFCSVKSIAFKRRIPFQIINNVNDKLFVDHVKKINPDLIISFSAPQVIKEPLLSLPKYGIINVHGSLLPDYRGLMPSFWYLFNNEKIGGATVHYMSKNIDDGSIILQDKASLEKCKSMFDVMNLTKEMGGNLMVSAILKIINQTVDVKPNNTSEGRYFTWPTVEQAKEFRQNGKRLI